MPLSPVDRGVLERFIDDMKKGQATRLDDVITRGTNEIADVLAEY